MLRFVARVRMFGVATALAIASLGIVAPVPAAATTGSQNFKITVGGGDFQALSITRFLPSEVTVHRGDTLEFDWGGFHTVTFNQPSNLWLFDYFNGPLGSTSLDTPSAFISSVPAFSQTGPPPPFVVTIGNSLPNGKYNFNCRLHQYMHGSVRVVDGDLPKTPDQVQAQGNAQLAAEMARAGKLDAQFAAQPGPNHALAGAGDKTLEFVKFYPSQINATVGVPLMFTDLDKHEPHTVSFGAVPGDPRDPATGVFPSGANPNAFDGTSALNSGFLFYKSQYEYWNIKNSPLAAAQPRSTFSLTFTKAGKYNYYCEIHGGFDPTTGQVFGMSGTITVAAG